MAGKECEPQKDSMFFPSLKTAAQGRLNWVRAGKFKCTITCILISNRVRVLEYHVTSNRYAVTHVRVSYSQKRLRPIVSQLSAQILRTSMFVCTKSSCNHVHNSWSTDPTDPRGRIYPLCLPSKKQSSCAPELILKPNSNLSSTEPEGSSKSQLWFYL